MARLWLAFLLCAACTPRRIAVETTREATRSERAELRGSANIQRTMRLLETSSAAHPHRVRILFYGQSITQSAWSRHVAGALRARYPHAQLELQNRALGGFSSERLVETAETDLIPWQPDLVIFHVYGAHDRYRALIERVRSATSAELMLATDHVTDAKDLDEPRTPEANPPDAAHWSGFMNQVFLPSLVEREQVALCDVRSAWKQYLRAHALPPRALLLDAIHLDATGDRLMAQLIESCLRREPTLDSPAEQWVKRIEAFGEGDVRLEVQGHRIEAALDHGTLHARIDGKLPSEHTELYRFARAHVRGGDKWPPLRNVNSNAPLALETFTFVLTREGDHFSFRVTGTRSGDEGQGRTDQRFVSRSGRIVLTPESWDIAYAFELMGRAVPEAFEVELRVEPHFNDVLGTETRVIASGLSPGTHVLELRGSGKLRSLTVYRSAR